MHLFKDVYNCNLINAFKHFQDIGVLEIITCGATHGYFPILYVNEKTVKAQIAVGVQTYERYFGRKPRGIWLPECGYVPEADKYLKEFGIDYVITESHGILYADPTPLYGTFAPIVSPEGVIAFGRDIESSRQVWSSINGYPGDFNYREFYRDIGYEADYDYIKPYIAHNGVRVHTGIKYYRITGKSEFKDYYNVQWAKDSAEKQAGHFLDSRNSQIDNLAQYTENIESSRQVWSSINGYPGDFNYREFYRDIGYEADYDYIKPYIAHNGVRVHTGIKYYRITGKSEFKDYYNVQWAKDSAEKQAGHFLDSRNSQIDNLAQYTENPPIVLCPYDAELYGHWWYEGPYWLYILFKKIYYDDCNFELITPSEYIDKYPNMQIASPCRSSWGANGYSEVWLNPTNDYAHRHLHVAGDRMCELAQTFPNSKGLRKKALNQCARELLLAQSSDWLFIITNGTMVDYALNQCARELLLAQSSDWLFIITNGTMVDYAKKRIKDHIGRFTKLYNQIKNDEIDEEFLDDISKKDCVFPDIDYMLYY